MISTYINLLKNHFLKKIKTFKANTAPDLSLVYRDGLITVIDDVINLLYNEGW